MSRRVTTDHPDHPDQAGPTGQPVLLVVEGHAVGQSHAVGSDELVIGRDGRESDLILPDTGVSRRHAKITPTEGRALTLVDLGSRNGTFVDGSRIDAVTLQGPTSIRFGPVATVQLLFVTRDDATEVHGLTKRELEVASLVARGLTNDEIASQLSITIRTVTTHLGHIYARLGLRSRTELTRHMLQRARLFPPPTQ